MCSDVCEADVLPGLARVGGLVDAVAEVRAALAGVLARADPDDVRILRIDDDAAEREGSLIVEDRRERDAAVGGFPQPAERAWRRTRRWDSSDRSRRPARARSRAPARRFAARSPPESARRGRLALSGHHRAPRQGPPRPRSPAVVSSRSDLGLFQSAARSDFDIRNRDDAERSYPRAQIAPHSDPRRPEPSRVQTTCARGHAADASQDRGRPRRHSPA